MSNDWTQLADVVYIMQDVVGGALERGDDAAHEFLEATHAATQPRIEALQACGIDVTDEMVLFTYCMGFSQATTIAHHVTHAYEFHSFDDDVEPDDECTLFVHSILSNLLPLMPLIPLHLVLGMDGWSDELDTTAGGAE